MIQTKTENVRASRQTEKKQVITRAKWKIKAREREENALRIKKKNLNISTSNEHISS